MKKSIDTYLKFMWNQWSDEVCFEIFGEDLGSWLFGKWLGLVAEYGHIGAPAVFWADIDTECQEAICNYIKISDYEG